MNSEPIDGEVVAPGFEIYSPDSIMGQINDSWLITGCLPSDDLWRDVSHYDLERYLINAGLLTETQCDSESGQFFAYPIDEVQARAVGGRIEFLLDRASSFFPLQ